MTVHWQLKFFADLTVDKAYAILRLRQDVFIVEQNCPYRDLDGVDASCQHLSAWVDSVPVAYLRIVPPHVHPAGLPSLGRICTAMSPSP